MNEVVKRRGSIVCISCTHYDNENNEFVIKVELTVSNVCLMFEQASWFFQFNWAPLNNRIKDKERKEKL